MQTHDEMIVVIQAHKEGKAIQCNSLNNRVESGWLDDAAPCWAFNYLRYRVKPEPVRHTVYVNVYKGFVSDLHPDRVTADRHCSATRLGCRRVEISCLPGQLDA